MARFSFKTFQGLKHMSFASAPVRTVITACGWPFHSLLVFCVCWKEIHLRGFPLRGLITLLISSGHCCSEEGCTSAEMREEGEAQALPFQAILCE